MKIKISVIRMVFASAIYSAIFLSCQTKPATLPFFNSAEFEPEWISPSDSKFTRIHRIADFSFYNQDSQVITNKTFASKIYVTDFFFTTCPSICPKMTDSMLDLQEEFKDESKVLFLSHTVTPWKDSIPQLKSYATKKGVIKDKWHLVTGPEEDIYTIARESYFAEEELGLQKTVDDFLHTENFLLIDSKRRIRGIFNGTSPKDIKRLTEDIYILLAEM